MFVQRKILRKTRGGNPLVLSITQGKTWEILEISSRTQSSLRFPAFQLGCSGRISTLCQALCWYSGPAAGAAGLGQI